jgi:hypothetical protein
MPVFHIHNVIWNNCSVTTTTATTTTNPFSPKEVGVGKQLLCHTHTKKNLPQNYARYGCFLPYDVSEFTFILHVWCVFDSSSPSINESWDPLRMSTNYGAWLEQECSAPWDLVVWSWEMLCELSSVTTSPPLLSPKWRVFLYKSHSFSSLNTMLHNSPVFLRKKYPVLSARLSYLFSWNNGWFIVF